MPQTRSVKAGVALLALLGTAPTIASETIAYSYDVFGRLVAVDRSGTINNNVQSAYSYDKADNRQNVTVDDGMPSSPPSFAIANAAAITEGGTLVFTVTKTGTTSSSFSVNYATANGTATSGSDYTAKSGTLTFTAVQTSQTINVSTIDDTAYEANETVLVNLSSPSGGATITTAQASGTINNNDAPNTPPVAVSDSGTQGRCSYKTYNVVANDTDADGDYPLTVIAVTGGAVVASSTSVGFTSDTTTGSQGFTYTVRDSRGATATGTLTVNVSGGPAECP